VGGVDKAVMVMMKLADNVFVRDGERQRLGQG